MYLSGSLTNLFPYPQSGSHIPQHVLKGYALFARLQRCDSLAQDGFGLDGINDIHEFLVGFGILNHHPGATVDRQHLGATCRSKCDLWSRRNPVMG